MFELNHELLSCASVYGWRFNYMSYLKEVFERVWVFNMVRYWHEIEGNVLISHGVDHWNYVWKMVGALCLWSRRKENIVAKSIFQVRPITNNKYTMYINSFICLHLNVEMKPMDNNTYSAICCAWYGYGYGTYFFRLKHSNIAMD